MCSAPWKKNIYSEVSVLDHEAINQREGTSYKTGSKAASAYWKFSQFAATLYGQKRSPSHCTYRRFYDILSYIRMMSSALLGRLSMTFWNVSLGMIAHHPTVVLDKRLDLQFLFNIFSEVILMGLREVRVLYRPVRLFHTKLILFFFN